MASSWHNILGELKREDNQHDRVRRRYLKNLHKYTKRNVIIYYSGWLQKPDMPGTAIDDADKNGFMATIHKLKPELGLDLLLHTPGGGISATESLVEYLHSKFGNNIRAFIPQIALSAGTMIACACKEIYMGKQSSLGPIDPQIRTNYGFLPAHGVFEEFNEAYKEIKKDPAKIPLWQPIIAKYSPTLIGECQKAIKWSNSIVREWLSQGMLHGQPEANKKAEQIVTALSDHALTLAHDRHLSAKRCRELGLTVNMLEDDQKLQDAVLGVHHACIHTFNAKPAAKIIENHNGVAFIQQTQQAIIQVPLSGGQANELAQFPLMPTGQIQLEGYGPDRAVDEPEKPSE